jgi:AraC-like DNA-binding protein
MLGTKATVEELAFLCNTSLSSFKRRFFNIYGMPPKKWVIRQKILLAANLLKHPDECAGSVYAKVGYETQASFTKAFKQYHGLTPRAYQIKNLDF